MMKRPSTRWLLFSALILAALPNVLLAGNEEIVEAEVTRLGKEDNQVMDRLDFLVNQIGPRLTASTKDVRACEWVRDQLESYGLENVVMEEAGEFPVGFERGPWKGRMVEPVEMALEFGTSAWSAGTKGIVQGKAVMAPATADDLDTAVYEGKWVLVPRQRNRRDADAQRKRRAVTNLLGKSGIAGFVYGTTSQYVRTGGSPRISWDKLPTVPRINMVKDHWAAIAERLENDEDVTLEFEIRNHFVKGPVKYYNVSGDLVGTEFPDEYVILGGHIDSWDGATGTTDNGIGVAVTLEAARLLAKSGAKPRRTMRFSFWSGEEQGLLGSRAYIRQYESTLEDTSAVFVWDGGTNVAAGIPSSEAMAEDLHRAFASVKDLNPDYPFEIKVGKGLPVGIGSDHDAFLRANVPGFFWTQKGRQDYRIGMHTQFDTFDLAIPEYLEHSVMVVALGGFGVANLDNKLSRENLRAPRAAAGRRMGVFLDELAVENVVPGSVAEKAGVKAGDVFQKVNDAVVSSRRELVRAIVAGEPRKKVVLMRSGKPVELIFEWPEEKKSEGKKKATF